MKSINKFRKPFYLTTLVLTLATLQECSYKVPAFSQFDTPSISHAENLFCYMQTEDSQIVSLENLCKVKQQRPINLSSKDRQFLEDYKKLLRGYPQAQAALSRVVEQNPQVIISKAAQLCNELKTGKLSDDRINQPDVDADILNSVAPEYYCPQFND